MKTKLVLRYDPGNRLLRLVRFTYNRGRNQLTVGMTPRVFGWVQEFGSTILTICGVRVHFKNSTGGVFAD